MLEHVRAGGEEGVTDTNLRRKPGVSKVEQRKYDEAVKFLTTYKMWEVKKGNRGARYVSIEGKEPVEEAA